MSKSVSVPDQPSQTIRVPDRLRMGFLTQPSPTVHNRCVPQVVQDGARPLYVAQVAVLLGWTKDAVLVLTTYGPLFPKTFPPPGPTRAAP